MLNFTLFERQTWHTLTRHNYVCTRTIGCFYVDQEIKDMDVIRERIESFDFIRTTWTKLYDYILDYQIEHTLDVLLEWNGVGYGYENEYTIKVALQDNALVLCKLKFETLDNSLV